jgi:AhpC/TSA family
MLAWRAVRPPAEARILAPEFPKGLPWMNVAMLKMAQQRGRVVVVEFWDFLRVNSLRTVPYLKAWHERYADDGLRVIGIHSGAFPPSFDEDAVRAAVERLGIPYAVVLDAHQELWEVYGNRGWPGRYVWDQDLVLTDIHYGEGAYIETELLIQELLGVEREPLAPVRLEDEPGLLLRAQTADSEGPYSGPYEAGAVWAVLDGHGTARANGREFLVDGPGVYPLVEHERHTAGVLELEIGEGVTCYATCFTPGAPDPEDPRASGSPADA